MNMSNADDQLRTTRDFWDANPCGVHSEYIQQRDQRYAMEPWLPAILRDIATCHRAILEVGCGQGVDSSILIAQMVPSGSYIGIDYSPRSVEVAKRNAVLLADRFSVKPEYRVGNAEALAFDDEHFDAVYSMGVLHHTANERKAIEEVRRVLAPGGEAFIFLYRKYAPKVVAAKVLRGAQHAFDLLLGTDRCVYQLLKQRSTDTELFGTMFHECFGVPYMKWYSRREVMALFRAYSDVKLISIGANLGRYSPGGKGPGPFGYFWFIRARK
jgi:SAM-dependent methyltransferase